MKVPSFVTLDPQLPIIPATFDWQMKNATLTLDQLKANVWTAGQLTWKQTIEKWRMSFCKYLPCDRWFEAPHMCNRQTCAIQWQSLQDFPSADFLVSHCHFLLFTADRNITEWLKMLIWLLQINLEDNYLWFELLNAKTQTSWETFILRMSLFHKEGRVTLINKQEKTAKLREQEGEAQLSAHEKKVCVVRWRETQRDGREDSHCHHWHRC